MTINVPNQLTLGRLCLAIVLLALLSFFDAAQLAAQRWLLHVCFWVYLVAAVTDVLDGLLARLTKSETSFGRILDPVVDKVIVCGVFVLFSSQHFWNGHANVAGVQPWMAIVIVGRELLVSALRVHAESGGMHFGAQWTGKAKMFVQSVAICLVLAQLAWDMPALTPARDVCVWLAVIITLLSAVSYLHRARGFLFTRAALVGGAAAADAAAANHGEKGDRP